MHRRRGRHDADALEQIAPAESHDLASVEPRYTEAPQLARVLEREAVFFRNCRRSRAAQRMIARRSEASPQLPQQRGIHSGGGFHIGKPQIARGHGSSLVEDDR